MEGSSWTGREVQDDISVGGEDRDEEAFPLRFGCQTDITGLFEGQIPDGIFGMNKHNASAIMQWSNSDYLEASAFSLCYNIREDVKKKSGVMVLGGANTRLHEKPMIFAKDVGQENYKVRIKQIHLQRGTASASTGTSTPKSLGLDGTDTAVLDSGTTCTYLSGDWREPLEEGWEELTGGKYPMFSYLDISEDELDELPTILFQLEGTKDNETITVGYPPIRYLEKSLKGGYDFCLYPYPSGGPVTLGNTFMSGHDVLHDLDNKRIGFAESKCQITKIGTSVETDADKQTKVIPLQSEPTREHKAATPGLKFLYVLLAFSVVAVVGLVVYHRKRKASSNSTTAMDREDGFEPPKLELT